MPPKNRLSLLLIPLLAACQSAPNSAPNVPETASKPVAQWQTPEQLEAATRAFLEQRPQDPSDRDRQQRALASAWMQRGQQALEAGDVNSATAALMRARSLLPQAPALTNDLGNALQPKRGRSANE